VRTHRRTDAARRALAALTTLALVVALAACGDDDGDAAGPAAEGSSGDRAHLEAAIEKAKKIPTFTLEAEPFDVGDAKDKTIFNIPNNSQIPYLAALDREMKKIAERVGVRFTQFNNQGSPAQWAQGVDQAISQSADLILLEQSVAELLVPQLQRAKKAGIPVLQTHMLQNGEKPAQSVRDLLTATVTAPFQEAARLEIDYALVNGAKNLLIINAEEIPPSAGIVAAMHDELDKECPDCKVTTINVPPTEWGTKIRPEVQSALTKDPAIDFVVPIYDSMALGAEAGIRAAGKTSSVRIVTYNGTPDILKLIQDGDITVMDVGENVNWLAWANMDQALRILAGVPPIADGNQETPLRIFDDSNVADAGTPPTTEDGYGDAYVEGYEKLWGLSN
jgi:ribose transport system substrate-binding protein